MLAINVKLRNTSSSLFLPLKYFATKKMVIKIGTNMYLPDGAKEPLQSLKDICVINKSTAPIARDNAKTSSVLKFLRLAFLVAMYKSFIPKYK